MTPSRLSLNIKVANVANWGVTRAFVNRLEPVALVACVDNMNDRNRIFELHADNPNTMVIGRFIDVKHDGGYHTKPDNGEKWLVSPENFLNAYHELGENGLKLYTLNEASSEANSDTIARLVEWTLEVIKLANERGIALCIFNWGVGHPLLFNGQWDSRYDPILEALSNSTQHVLGMHLYAPADLNARLNAMIARCKVIKDGIQAPRVVITEFGFDAAYGGDPLNGYKTRGYSDLYFANWCIDKVANLYKPYIVSGVLIAVCTFIWGDRASWGAWNVEYSKMEEPNDWAKTVLQAKDNGTLTITAQAAKPSVPAPSNKGVGTPYTITDTYNLRAAPTATGALVGRVIKDEQITVYKDTRTVAGADTWHYIERAAPSATESASGWCAWPLPPEPPPVILPTEFVVSSEERAEMLDLLARLSVLFTKLQERIK